VDNLGDVLLVFVLIEVVFKGFLKENVLTIFYATEFFLPFDCCKKEQLIVGKLLTFF